MATEDANLDSGGTLESGIEQGVVTEDNVTKEGESGNTTGIDPLSGNMIEGGQESSTSGNSQSIVDSNLSEPKSKQKSHSRDPDSGTLSQSDRSEENLGLDYLIIDEPKSRQKDRSHDPNVSDNDSNTCASILSKDELTLPNSPCVSDSSSMIPRETNIKFLEKGEENLLQGKLLSLNLSREDIHFILEQGDKFLERPHLLATKLKIDPDTAKASIEALKCFKCEKPTNHISQHDRMLIEDCLRENPQYSTPEDISLLTDVPLQMVASYLQDRPLDDKQKTDIKEKVDIGNSVREIAILLRLSPKKVQEYVDNLRNRPLDDKQKTDIKEKVDIGNSVREIAVILRLSPKKVQEYVDNLQNRPLDDEQKADIKKKVDIGNSVQEIAVILRLSPKKVQEYVDDLQNRPLDDEQKADIKKRVDIGIPVQEIAVILRLSPKKVQEYVDKTFLTFTGVEGKRCFEIINKNFGYSSTFQLRKLVLTNDLKLLDRLCFILLKRNEREQAVLKKYFQKFGESKSFFEINYHLTFDDILQINQSNDIEHLSIKLNKPASIIREYLAQYKPNPLVKDQCELMQKFHLQELLTNYGMKRRLPFHSYRMIVTHPFEDMMKRAQTRQNPLQVFEELLPLAFYYLKCSLPFTEINQMFVSTGKSKLTTHELFHLIFQQSDPVLKAFCIEHYAFSNPVPFYYPNILSVNLNQTYVEFAFCSELWYSIQQYNGLISFGLGRACWNPIGKSHLLDMIFDTDFEKGNPQNSAFHHNSIDVQMTNNLFGETQRLANESIKWAFIDCNGQSNRKLIKLICQQLNIALIQVSFQDYQNHKERFRKEVSTLTNSTKHVYLFIRDYPGEEVIVDMTNKAYKLIYIPNLTKPDVNIDSVRQSVRNIGYEILHLNLESSKTLENEFIEKVMTEIDHTNLKEILVEKSLVRKILECVPKSTQKLDFSFLHYYPLFVDYMNCYYQASYETDQKIIDTLHSESKLLYTKLSNATMGEIVKHFSRIIERENSSLIIWRLSQALAQLTHRVVTENSDISKELREQATNRYSLEILWREVLLSSKYGKLKEEGREEFLRGFEFSYSNYVERGEPFELIDGDNLRYFNQDIDSLLSNMYRKRIRELEFMNKDKDIKIKQAPIVVSIFGPQSSGKSTLLNYLFGCKFLTSTGRCTKGIYASLAKLSRPVNCSNQFLILDTEGLDAIGRGSLIQFDRTMVLFCLAVSQVVIINVKGEIGRELQNLLQICAYSLNKLKVRRVTAPQIFFVLNQQADPNITNHLKDINILMERLNKELVDTEGKTIIASELIKISPKNLFVLPSAFNLAHFNKHSLKLFDSKVIKLSPTTIFADKCADLRIAIIDRLDCMPFDERTSFETMSEWLEISGTIWDTVIKYQDIVKYGNVEEMMCSDLLRKIIFELMDEHIYAHKRKFIEETAKVSTEIREMNILGRIDDVLRNILEQFEEFFQPYKNTCLHAYKERCQTDTLLRSMNNICKEHELNLNRLIYVQYIIYEDKIKFQISAVKIEKKIHESMKKFQEAINRDVDSYLELSVEQQKSSFEQTWTECFEDEDYIKEEVERNEIFERLYSLFKMEFRAMENKTEILNIFRTERYQMENIISIVQNEILCGFLEDPNVQGEKHFIFTIQEHNTPLRAMTPFPNKSSCQYLLPDCIYKIVTEKAQRKTEITLLDGIPSQCKPLVKYCSGYYNYPDVQWEGWRMDKQILTLASQLKSPRNLHVSTWQLLIEDIDTVKKFIDIDPSVSPVTIKEIINHLYSIFQVVNYELGFIQARLTNTAERTISKLVFAYAFKSLWETKQQNRLEHDQKKEKEKQGLLQYFLQKIKVRKMFRRGLDREEMKETDLQVSQKFALDLLGAVKRGILSEEQPSIESSFNERKEELSHKNLLDCGNGKLSHELSCNPGENDTNSDNFVVRYICDRNVELRKLFFQKWEEIQEQLSSQLVTEMTNKFNKRLEPLKMILSQLLVDIVESRDKAGSSENKAFDSDSNFEIANMKTCKFDSEIDIKESPFKAMVIFLQIYLDPNISPEAFAHFFQNEFEVGGVKMKTSDTYKLCIKSINNPNHIIDREMFKKLSDTTMFSSDNIFNLFDYVTQFLSVLNKHSFKLKEEEKYMEIVKSIKDNFERDAIGCPNKCPSCGKLCERELHPNDGLCQIKTGHQICSMGGTVWNNDEDKTAVLYMCDDYQDNTNVVMQGGPTTWEWFKNKWGDTWDWTMPEDEHYVNLQKDNRQVMKNIWNEFGKGILHYYYLCNGTSISFEPYTASHDLFNRLTRQYFICFVIDGTVSMATEIRKTRISVGQFIAKYQELAQNSEFKVVIYRDHCDNHVIETFPKYERFTTQHDAVQEFLSSVQAVGGGDYPEAVLDGLATAATESKWKNTLGIKNLIIHIYDAPPHGNFPEYTSHDPKSNKKHCCCCNHGTGCHFDWDKDVWGSFKKFNIHYYGINTGQSIPEFEATMKAKLGDLCG